VLDPSMFTGAAGGSLAIAFGAGCAAGYGFAIRTAYRAVKQRLDKVEADARDERANCRIEILTLTTRQRELEDMLLGRRPIGFVTTPAPGPIEREAEKA
jgi:hypothetical protein